MLSPLLHAQARPNLCLPPFITNQQGAGSNCLRLVILMRFKQINCLTGLNGCMVLRPMHG